MLVLEQGATRLQAPELIGADSGWVFAHPVQALAEHLALLPAAELGATDAEGSAELAGGEPGAVGAADGSHHPILPSANSQRCLCQSRWERALVGFLATRCRPSLSSPERRMAKSVERLIARWEQSSAVVSQR